MGQLTAAARSRQPTPEETYFWAIDSAYAEYQTEVARLSADAAATWDRSLRDAANRLAEATKGEVMTTTTRTARVLTALACALIAAVFLTSAAPASAATRAKPCRTPDVAVILTHPVQQSGNKGVTVVVQDKGSRACTLDGYPGLGLLTIGGKPVVARVTDGNTMFAPDPGPRLLTLRPGGFAKAHISWGSPGRGRKASFLTVQLPLRLWHKTLLIPDAPARIWRGELSVTAFASARNG